MEYKKLVRSILGNRKLTIADQINQIKLNVNAGEYKEALKLNPLFNKTLISQPFFNDITDIYLKEPFSFTKEFKKEFKWVLNILENYYCEINSFLELKNNFEKHLILDEFDRALEIIKEVENLFGISLWSIEATLIIEEKVNGSESNWNLLTKYLNEINNAIYEFTINASSKRIESKLSYESFLNQFQNDIASINADGIIEDFFVFKNFNLVNYEYKYLNLESVLYVSNIFSVIDQYLIFIDVILYNVSKSNNYDKLFLSFIKEANNKIVNDVRLINIYNVLNDKKEIIETKNNGDVFECLNLYYSGNFEKAIEKANIGILNNPMEYEYYQVYCKSLLNLKCGFLSIDSSQTINNILKETYNLLSFKKEEEDSWNKQLKNSLFFMNTNLGKQIFGLLSEIEGRSDKNYIIGFLSSSYNSQNNIYLNNNRDNIAINFSPLIKNHCFKVQLYKNGINEHFEGKISESELQNVMIKALRNYRLENYNEVINLLDGQIDLDSNSYYYERKVYLLFYSYLNLNLLKDSLALFGKIFFDNSIITRKLNYTELYNKIRTSYAKDDFASLIEYPILFSLIIKEYDLYEANDEFLCSFNIFSVQDLEINSFIEIHSLEKTIYYLNNVVTIDTLKYSTEYQSINDVEEDRIKILNILTTIDSSNKLNYEKEINEIYRINSVRKVLKEVDEGRLYIDVTSLKEVQSKKFKDDFKRFKEIETSASSKTLIGFNTSNTKNWEKALTEKNEIDEKYNSADYLAFKSIYLESRENFLFSKEYGLDSCLSTRIRHGALKNHIRSVFEKLDLVTSKLKDNYRNNERWANQLSSIPEINNSVQILLKKFSKEIDDYTIYIVESLIQIETEKSFENKNGLFQYYTNDELLYNYYFEHKKYFDSIESTIDLILNQLVNYTLLNLQKTIVNVFTKGIPAQFNKIIENLVSELRHLNLPNECDLITTLSKANTEIQNELEYLSEWFYLNTTSSSSLLSIETIIRASLNLTNRINPLYNLEPKINIKNNFAGYSNLIFVFNIMFKNVIEHSKLNSEKINLKVDSSIDEINNYVLLKFSHNLNSTFDYSTNKKKLETIKQNWNNHENIDRSNKEGESGYDKIKRILLYEALAKTDKFDYNINKDSISITLFFPYKKTIVEDE
ncbi:MAG: hypothetical protein ACOVSR_01490 [Bacteroidia bacterium]